jgi:hypothetical protein
MPGNRKAAEELIVDMVSKIDESGFNADLYKKKFAAMSDADFDAMIEGLEKGTVNLVFVAPNFGNVKIDVEKNLDLAQELGFNFFERINLPQQGDIPAYLTPIPYLVVRVPVRRQAQLLEKKISIPDSTAVTDDLTGQVTGSSKGSKISYPEVQVLAAAGLDNMLTELLKVRGGDEGAFNAFSTMISRSGEATLNSVEKFSTGVQAQAALSVLLRGMMINSTLKG